LSHDLVNQQPERGDAGGGVAAADDAAAPHIPRREISQRPAPRILVPHPRRLLRVRWRRGMAPGPRLDAGLLVGAEDTIGRVQGLAVPPALIQVEDAPGFGGEVRDGGSSSRKYR